MERHGRVALFLLLSLCFITPAHSGATAPDASTSVAPFTFADPDGLELVLEKLSVRAAVSGPLSLTEMEMTFRNPRNRRTEGRFSCVLPEDATISRLAKEVNGQLMEGEVVERLRANRIYEDILNEARDPALLEQDQGNRFAVKIFPIEPNASVRIVLSWSKLLRDDGGSRTLTVPLRGLSKIGSFSFVGHFADLPAEAGSSTLSASDGLEGAKVSTSQVVSFDRTDWTPDRNLTFRWAADRKDRLLRAGDDWIAVLHPPVRAAASTPATRPLVFYVDTSASSAEGLLHRVRALETVLDALGDRHVKVHAFDHSVQPLLEGSAREVSALIGAALLKRGFLGATNIDGMLRHLSGLAEEKPDRTFVIVSDGAATIGRTASRAIADVVSGLRRGVIVHALILGSRRDDVTLRAITEERGRLVAIPFTTTPVNAATEAAASLVAPLGETIALEAGDAEYFWPSRADDLRPGSEVIVVGRTKRGTTPKIAILDQAGTRHRAGLDVEILPDRFAPLLEREAARGYLALLARRERDETVPALREALIAEQVRVSVASRVVIPRTTLLVLESEHDYMRFGVNRQALGRILTIGPAGIDVVDRTRMTVASSTSLMRTGLLSGRVMHEGGPLPGVTVTISSPAIAGTRTAFSNVDGSYRFPALPPGQYQVRIELEGMEARHFATTVTGGRTSHLGDASLSLPSIAEAITVTAVTPVVLETTEVQSNFIADAIEELPVQRMLVGGEPKRADVMRSSGVAEAITVTASAPAEIEDTAIRTTVTNDGSIRPLPGVSTRGSWSRSVPQETVRRWTEPSRKPLGALEQAVKDHPLDRAAWSALGEELARREKWSRVAEVARAWQLYDPHNAQVYELLGDAALAADDRLTAERAFGSLVETAAANPELVQRAGMLLFRMGNVELAESALRIACEARPDRINAWRHLALVVWQAGRHGDATAILEEALAQQFSNRQHDVHRVLREELGHIIRDWIRTEPDKRAALERRAVDFDVDLTRHDALRITLAWDTDANDVDLHVIDPSGEEVYFEHQLAASGLELYDDITQGFGPEVARTARLQRGTYEVGVNYYAVGPMGVSRGIIVVIRDDETSGPAVQVLPFRLRPEGDSVVRVARLDM